MSSLLDRLYSQGIDSTIQRQLNRLPQSMRPLLMAAAVAGETVDLALMRQLIDQLGCSFTLKEWLIRSVSAALLEVDNDQTRFADEATRLTLVDSLRAREKIEWHEQIVTGLESIYVNAPVQAATLAFHWQQVGNVQKERRYARLAGEYAYQQYEYETAVRYLSRALDLTSADDLSGQYDLLLAREQVYLIQGDRDAQKDDLTRLAEIADLLTTESDEEWRTEVALRLGVFAEVTGEYTVAIVAATEALRLAAPTESPAHEARSYLLWGQALLRQGKYAEAQGKLQLSQVQAETHQLPWIIADSLRFLGVCATDLGQFDQARQHYDEALSLYRALDDKRGESTILSNLSIVAYAQNQLRAAMAHWEEARQIHEAIGDKEGTARVLSNLSSVCLDLGEYEKGRAFSQEALAICREADLRFGQGMNLINLSLFSLYLHDDHQAEIYSGAALDAARKMGSLPLEGLALKDRAYMLLHWQQYAEAEQAYQQALAIWQELSQPLQLLEVQAGLARVALQQEDLAQARVHIQSPLAYLQAGNTPLGASRPFFIYLVCYEVLAASGNSEAIDILRQSRDQQMLLAEKITDESQRQAFFRNVPEHRQIRELCEDLF